MYKKDKKIIVCISGGLGNQMFQYALGRFLSLKYNVPLMFDLTVIKDRTPRPKNTQVTFRSFELDVFCIAATIADQNDIPVVFRSYFTGRFKLFLNTLRHRLIANKGKEERNGIFQSKILTTKPTLYLEGHWQNEKYFSEIRETIKKDFTLRSPVSVPAQKVSDELDGHQTLCLHIRRTDALRDPLFGGLQEGYYDRAVAYVRERVAIEKIYVFSDDIEWCRNNLHFSPQIIFIGPTDAGGKPEEHLVLMSLCTHFIIPSSSFSWWAAWLSSSPEKIVIAPKIWFYGQSEMTDDIVPSSWVRL